MKIEKIEEFQLMILIPESKKYPFYITNILCWFMGWTSTERGDFLRNCLDEALQMVQANTVSDIGKGLNRQLKKRNY